MSKTMFQMYGEMINYKETHDCYLSGEKHDFCEICEFKEKCYSPTKLLSCQCFGINYCPYRDTECKSRDECYKKTLNNAERIFSEERKIDATELLKYISNTRKAINNDFDKLSEYIINKMENEENDNV